MTTDPEQEPAPLLAIIGGTGLNSFVQGEVIATPTTPFGDVSGELVSGAIAGSGQQHNFVFLARHGSPHKIPPHLINYRANIWALKQAGVKRIIAVNAVGGIRADLVAGSLVVPDQIVDYSYGREHTFFDGTDYPLDHIDLSYPYSEALRQALLTTAQGLAYPIVNGAVYAATQGPRLETAAEINRLERDGCDIVGMTAMPEAALARESGMDYASLCLVVNPAAGRSAELITMEQINAVIDTGMEQVKALLTTAIPSLS